MSFWIWNDYKQANNSQPFSSPLYTNHIQMSWLPNELETQPTSIENPRKMNKVKKKAQQSYPWRNRWRGHLLRINLTATPLFNLVSRYRHRRCIGLLGQIILSVSFAMTFIIQTKTHKPTKISIRNQKPLPLRPFPAQKTRTPQPLKPQEPHSLPRWTAPKTRPKVEIGGTESKTTTRKSSHWRRNRANPPILSCLGWILVRLLECVWVNAAFGETSR